MTKNSKMILEIVTESNEHLTAEQIFLKAKKRSPRIVLATVYNNLNALTAAGMIRRITLPGSPDRYDKTARHDHMVCDECGKLSDITLEDLSREIENKAGTPILFYDLRVHYICEECRKTVHRKS